ncbi:hypothetical protein Aph01nite_11540 [Acrocarpospora phusangensis]|uniref:Uncharacterized protein n=1 Tax=Acrocarpospora phusangensis TaxID=1070424 RepID=A0A919Q5P4_9ACTN|nr:class 1 isoprenoid biosynthesis enzyme [Acrocarpospora phusangensis]GIH22844.1 hypothetical protein Aph01nite_11540 [Acrocarpospora phusangensis]
MPHAEAMVWSVTMRAGIRDLISVLHCSHLAIALPTAIRIASTGTAEAVPDFARAVAPIIDDVLRDPAERKRMHDALLGTAITFNFGIRSYSVMARQKFDGEVSVLGGSMARLYDDLVDSTEGDEVDAWLAGLFETGRATPRNDIERLLVRMYQAINDRLPGPDRLDVPGSLLHDSLVALHEFQVLSREQRNPEISSDKLEKIARGKGGFAALVLFGLIRRRMSVREHDLIMELGEALQLMDDYLDHDADLRNGIATPVNRGDLTLSDIGARFRALRARLSSFYGKGPARPFVAMMFLELAADACKRRRPRRRPSAREFRETPLRLLIRGGPSAIPTVPRTGRTP